LSRPGRLCSVIPNPGGMGRVSRDKPRRELIPAHQTFCVRLNPAGPKPRPKPYQPRPFDG
jgi:hypothetical protein